jgi:hypothetical protein
MASGPRVGRPTAHLGLMVAFLLIITTIIFLIIGSWKLSDGLNDIVIDHTNPHIHFSETTSAQEVTNGIIGLVLGAACFVTFVVLLVK